MQIETNVAIHGMSTWGLEATRPVGCEGGWGFPMINPYYI
jgi:hypothetical protein